jgi:dTDP-4-dehydrorhamnose 3,5-epimerase
VSLRAVQTELPGVVVIEPLVHGDSRGFFLETFHAEKYKAIGIEGPFVQDNHSKSIFGTVRGLHLQLEKPQGKLVRVIEGEIFDVAVDVRRGSPHFGKWVGVRLSAMSFRQCYVPAGFAHGFSVLSDSAQVEYKCTDFYDPADEFGIAWDDPALAISWQIERPILSARDRSHPTLAAAAERLPAYRRTDL